MRLFKKPFSFSGRIQRVEYILTVVTAVLFPLISAGISYEYTRSESFAYAISSLLAIPSAWFLFAQGAKRCHDLGNSGWLQLILPISIWLMLFMKGEQQANEYGELPSVSGAVPNWHRAPLMEEAQQVPMGQTRTPANYS
jgi:uncharacterized membrane protein YhaH (DUF805 family)